MGLGEGSEVSLKFSQAEKVSEVRQQLQDSMYSTSVWNDKESVSFLCVFFYTTFTEAKDFRKPYSKLKHVLYRRAEWAQCLSQRVTGEGVSSSCLISSLCISIHITPTQWELLP